MKTNRIYGILVMFLILAAIPTVEAGIIYRTDKLVYKIGEPIKFTIKNTGTQPVMVDIITVQERSHINWDWMTVYDPNACPDDNMACAAIAVMPLPIQINPKRSYSWTWDQSLTPAPDACVAIADYDCTKADTGTYRGVSTLYDNNGNAIKTIRSNIFKIR